MKKLLLLFFVLIFCSFAFAQITKVDCGSFDLEKEGEQYCEKAVNYNGIKGTIEVHVLNGEYSEYDNFEFDVSAYFIIEGKGKYQLDCDDEWYGGGDTLEMDDSDDYSFKQGCGDYDLDLITLNIQEPNPKFGIQAEIASEDDFKSYFQKKFGQAVFEAKEVSCTGSGSTFSGDFSVNSYCFIPLEDYKGKIKIEVAGGAYASNQSFNFPINAYLILEDGLLSQDLLGEHQLDCDGMFSNTLEFKTSSSGGNNSLGINVPKTAQSDCVFGGIIGSEKMLSLTAEGPNLLSNPPFDSYIKITAKLSDNLVKKFFKKKVAQTITKNDSRMVESEFYVVYPKTEGFWQIKGTSIKINLDSIDYSNKKVVFKLTNSNTEEELCIINSAFAPEETDYINCSLANVKITGINPEGAPKGVGGEKRFYFNAEVKGITTGAVELKETDKETTDGSSGTIGTQATSAKPAGQTSAGTTAPQEINVDETKLSALQEKINDYILIHYYGGIFDVKDYQDIDWVKEYCKLVPRREKCNP